MFFGVFFFYFKEFIFKGDGLDDIEKPFRSRKIWQPQRRELHVNDSKNTNVTKPT